MRGDQPGHGPYLLIATGGCEGPLPPPSHAAFARQASARPPGQLASRAAAHLLLYVAQLIDDPLPRLRGYLHLAPLPPCIS